MIGHLTLEVKTAAGRLLRKTTHRNKITDAGLNVMRDRLLGGGREVKAIAIGTGTATPAASDIALGGEVFRKELSRSSSGNKLARFQVLIDTDEGNGNNLSEAGLFDNVVAGYPHLVARVVYDAVQKTSSIQLTYTWEIEFAETS